MSETISNNSQKTNRGYAKSNQVEVKCIPCKRVFKMVFWHHWVTNQGVDIFWNRIRVCRRNIFIYIFYINSILRKSTSTSNHGNIHIKPLATTGLISWDKYAWLLTSSDYSNNSYRWYPRFFNLQKATCINFVPNWSNTNTTRVTWILWMIVSKKSTYGSIILIIWLNCHKHPTTSL